MLRRLLFSFATLVAVFGATFASQLSASEPIVLGNFEGDDYQGWTATGDAFGDRPADAAVRGGMGAVFGHTGSRLVNTFAAPNNDGATGTLTSPPFVIERNYLTFLIGGGNFPGETGIELRVDGKVVATETGLFSQSRVGNEGLVRRAWDVKEYRGKTAQIVIFDKKAGGDWGHIKVDDVCAVDEVPPANVVEIVADAAPMEYSPMLFGQFIEHFHRCIYGGIFEPGSPLADEDGFRTDVIEALKEIKTSIVRWPGGCFVSAYHWLDGVGPNREPVYDKAWHVEDPNTFGTAEFVAWCRKIGAEPYICGNAGTGTPEEMSDWVEYCNLNIGKYGRLRKKHGYDEPFNVKYWSIGNENYGSHEMGAKTISEWGPFVRETAKLMLNTESDIRLFAAALESEAWTRPLLEAAGKWLDYVSIHGYWDSLYQGGVPASYLECMGRTGGPENSIMRTIDVLEKTKNRGRIKIAFDEWNLRGWTHPGIGTPKADIPARAKNDDNSTYTTADAIFSACFLNSCLRHCSDVEIACFSPIVNVRGALYVYPEGIVRRSTFYVFKMYANELEKNVLPTSLAVEFLPTPRSATPVFDAILTCDDAGKNFALAVINKDPENSRELRADFLGIENGAVSALVLSGESPDDYNDVGRETVVPREVELKIENGNTSFPPHSISIVKFSRN